MNRAVAESTREQFATDGVVCLRGVLDARALEAARAAFDWSLANPGRAANQFQGTADAPDRFYQDLLNPNALTGYRRMLLESPAADLVATLWGAPEVWFLYEQVFLKEGGESRRTPWHQDLSYLPIEGSRIAVMWISFDPVAADDSLEFVRGSHRGVLYNGSNFDPADDTAPLYSGGAMPRLPNIEADRARWDIVSWGVEPGDVIVFHPAMLHGGAPTHRARRRRTLSLRFFGADAKFATRPGLAPSGEGEPRSVFEDMARKLAPGDPFRHPAFLKLRPRQ
ncbi:MAG TPA: phytanoyl-CoA dioxygenase family protein [Candidatus Binataceae bacterium]|nr:phytanoyl-CoA dioxygenase family protein [Candidatus Binataceae bacterium]